ncbi:hypothetical protein QFC19_000451 [Naganishia cerealis]|uniref:Uncharacterized protein n=1 Tax=Naganishia cerealis TaxID=610337 RepID=A0ACC2WN62_9TREE|nr:hypothetical protein QFC19_000451 [Naganishia cerealis]
MADMLDPRIFQVDLELMKPDENRTFSAFETILRDMFAVYHTLLTAFAPHDPLVAVREGTEEALTLSTPESEEGVIALPRIPSDNRDGGGASSRVPPYSAPAPTPVSVNASGSASVAVPTSGPAIIRVSPGGIKEDWVESFFGLTRDMILRIGQVNGMVRHRAVLLRSGKVGTEAGSALRRSAELMVEELGGVKEVLDKQSEKAMVLPRELEQGETAVGKAGRIRRGTSVGSGLLLYTSAVDSFDNRLPR